MPTLQDLDARTIDEAVRLAVEKAVPIAACARPDGAWISLRSRFLAVDEQHILIEPPAEMEGETPYDFSPAEKIGMSFKLKHHKHICSATVAGPDVAERDGGRGAPVLRICWPTRMQRLQRRAFNRAEVPSGMIVRASFWLGGCRAEPAGTSPTTPVWSGAVTNISAGGVLLVCGPEPTSLVEPGDIVGMRLLFGLDSPAVYVDAQYRHVREADGEYQLGFQFIGLGQTQEGREALKRITSKVSEFQHIAEHGMVGAR